MEEKWKSAVTFPSAVAFLSVVAFLFVIPAGDLLLSLLLPLFVLRRCLFFVVACSSSLLVFRRHPEA